MAMAEFLRAAQNFLEFFKQNIPTIIGLAFVWLFIRKIF